jgi:hypothetical protein
MKEIPQVVILVCSLLQENCSQRRNEGGSRVGINETPAARLEGPRFENGKPMLTGGVRERYKPETFDDTLRSGSPWLRTSATFLDAWATRMQPRMHPT